MRLLRIGLAALVSIAAAPAARAADPLPDSGATAPLEDLVWGDSTLAEERPRYEARVAHYTREFHKLELRRDAARRAYQQRTAEWNVGQREELERVRREQRIGEGAARGMVEWGNRFLDAKARSDTLRAQVSEADLEDPRVRERVWAAHLEWLRLRNVSTTFGAVYQEQVLAHLDVYEGWDWTALMAGMQEDLYLVSSRVYDSLINEIIGGCVDDIVHKIGTDAAWKKALGWSPASAGGLVADCLEDVAKGAIVNAVIAATEVNFLRSVEQAGIPRPVGEYWWKEFVVAQARAKPGFGTAAEALFSEGRIRPTLYKVAGRTAKGLQKELVRQRVTAERVEWARGVVRGYVSEGRSKREIESFVESVVQDADESLKPYTQQAIDEALQWDRVLVTADVLEVFTKIGGQLYLAYLNYSEFSLANEAQKYRDIVACLSRRGEPTDVEQYQKVLAIYDTWIVTCRPDADAERDRDLARARERLGEIDVSRLPTDLPARAAAAQRALADFRAGSLSVTEAQVRDVIRTWEAYCGRDPAIFDQIRERMHDIRVGRLEIADAATAAERQREAACEAANVSAANTAADAAADAHVAATEALDAIRGLAGDLRADAASLPDAIDLFDALQEATDRGREIDEVAADTNAAHEVRRDLREKIAEGYRLAQRWSASATTTELFDPEARELMEQFEALRAQIDAIDLGDPTATDALSEEGAASVEEVLGLGRDQDFATTCGRDLPDLRAFSAEIAEIDTEADDGVRSAAANARDAAACADDFGSGIEEGAHAAIESCRFEEARDAIARFPSTAESHRKLTAALDEQRERDASNRREIDTALADFRARGDPDAALRALLAGIAQPLCPDTATLLENARSDLYTARFVAERVRAGIADCAFDATRRDAETLEAGSALRERLIAEIDDEQQLDDDARARAEAAWNTLATPGVSDADVIATLNSARDDARCSATRRVIQAWIDGVEESGAVSPAAVRTAIDACRFREADALIDRMIGRDEQRALRAELAERRTADDAARSAFEQAQAALERGEREGARTAAQRAGSADACPETRRAADGLVDRIARIDEAVDRAGDEQFAEQTCRDEKQGSRPVWSSPERFRCECAPGDDDLGNRCAARGVAQPSRPPEPPDVAPEPPPSFPPPPVSPPLAGGTGGGGAGGSGASGSTRCAQLQQQLAQGAADFQRTMSTMQTGQMSADQANRQMSRLSDAQQRLLATQRQYDMECRGGHTSLGNAGTPECARLSQERLDRSLEHGRLVEQANRAPTPQAYSALQPQLDAARARLEAANAAYVQHCEGR